MPWLEISRQDLTDGDLWQGRQAVGTVSVCEGGVMGGARDSLYLNGVTGSLELQNYFGIFFSWRPWTQVRDIHID